MDYLADSCAKLCQGGQDGNMMWKGIPVYDCTLEKCVLVVVLKSCDLSVC